MEHLADFTFYVLAFWSGRSSERSFDRHCISGCDVMLDNVRLWQRISFATEKVLMLIQQCIQLGLLRTSELFMLNC
jgi:hypothetical protein